MATASPTEDLLLRSRDAPLVAIEKPGRKRNFAAISSKWRVETAASFESATTEGPFPALDKTAWTHGAKRTEEDGDSARNRAPTTARTPAIQRSGVLSTLRKSHFLFSKGHFHAHLERRRLLLIAKLPEPRLLLLRLVAFPSFLLLLEERFNARGDLARQD